MSNKLSSAIEGKSHVPDLISMDVFSSMEKVISPPAKVKKIQIKEYYTLDPKTNCMCAFNDN